jgi:hypothetical protein
VFFLAGVWVRDSTAKVRVMLTRMRGRVVVDRCDELEGISDGSSDKGEAYSQRRSITSAPSDATASMSAHSGTTSLILVSSLSLASCPRVAVSFAMMKPVVIAVKSFEFDAMPKSVCRELGQRSQITCWVVYTHIARHLVTLPIRNPYPKRIFHPSSIILTSDNSNRGSMNTPVLTNLIDLLDERLVDKVMVRV